MKKETLLLLVLVILAYTAFVNAVYLPGIPRKTYRKADEVVVKTRKLSSVRNLPFDFYSVKFCRPEPIINSAENLGEYLFGDRIQNSVFKIKFLEDITCRRISTCLDETFCDPKIKCDQLESNDIEEFKKKIEDDYIAELIIDNLPVANKQDPIKECGELPPITPNDKNEKYTRPDGFPIGCKLPSEKDKKYLINNHLSFTIRYHIRDGEHTIVGAEVIPSSILHGEDSCKEGKPLPRNLGRLKLDNSMERIPFSYSVRWVESEVRWASRWDNYLTTADSEEYKIHWFSIINSLMIVLFLTVMVAMIMMRILNKDIAYYNRTEQEDPADETGWKLVHGDVFRSPVGYHLLSILAGSGVQVFSMAVITLIFALIGFLSPANRGNLMTVMILLFVLMGIFNGYYTQRFYKMFGGKSWKLIALVTALFFPGVIFGLFTLINFLVWAVAQSSGAIPFLTLMSIFAMWFGISVPLVFLGSYFGFKKQAIEHPVAVHRIPKQIPDQPIYMKAPIAILMGGILPFGAVFIELYFIMSSLWLHKFYYLFGFLFIVFVVLVLTCAEITIVMIYFQLCNEDYHWWWRSFLTAGSSAMYLFLYSVFYFFTKLKVDSFLMAVLFFGYMGIVTYYFFILTGSIGFFSSLWFVRKIYSSIKVD